MSQTAIGNVLRYALFLLGVMGLVLTFGFFTEQSWAKMLIPWELSRLASIFLASITIASSLPILWIAFTREYAAIMGGAINFFVLFFGFAAFSFSVYAANPRQPVLLFGIYCVIGFCVTLALVYLASRQKFLDARPMPRLVRYSFAFFAGVLILVGGSLALKLPNIFPWELTPQQSVLYGWIFLGAATYFIYGFVRPVWANAQGQLLGFLAYDLVLIGPFILLLFGNEPFFLTSLILYIAALMYSGALAVYYLFLKHDTRLSVSPAVPKS